jgi:hypothetical protein
MSNPLTLGEMKAALASGTVASLAGTKFLSGKGAIGTLLPTLIHGATSARFICTKCGAPHDRARGDWHQVGECHACRGTSSKKSGSSPQPSNKTPAEQLAALEAQLAAMKAAIAQRAETEELNKVLYVDGPVVSKFPVRSTPPTVK